MKALFYLLAVVLGLGLYAPTPASAQALFPLQHVSGPQVPGPSEALYASNPYYTCTTNYYVATGGSSGNTGTSAGSPWDINTAVGKNPTSLAPGAGSWCINVAPGTYNLSAINNNTLIVANGGTTASTTGYVVWRCTSMPFHFSSGVLQGEGSGCIIKNDTGSTTNAVDFDNAPYVMFDGWEFNGNATDGAGFANAFANNTPADAAKSHHVWLFNSDAHGWGAAGISLIAQDWQFTIHNVWHDNSNINTFDGSGYSNFVPVGLNSYSPTTQDQLWHSATTGLQYRYVIAYNVGIHNFNMQSGSANTDGEGIILDTYGHNQSGYYCSSYSGVTCPYDGATLVMGNLMWDNGGQGIEYFSTDLQAGGFATIPTTIVNNTMYDNGWDTHGGSPSWRGGGISNTVSGVKWMNNISIARTGTPTCSTSGITCPFLGEAGGSGNVWQTNISAPAGDNMFDGSADTYPTTGTNKNLDTTTPLGTLTPSSETNNFAIPSGASAAVGFGQAFDLWQQSGTIDAGACVYSAPGPLTNCP